MLKPKSRVKSVQLTEEQYNWIEKKNLCFSKYVRAKIEEDINNEGEHDD